MDSDTDSLQFVPVEKWVDLENVFKADGPRSIPAYNSLVTQKKILDLGLDYGFKVYCPYGDPSNGMVAFNKKVSFNEVIIHCREDNTSQLEEALVSTKIIDWSKGLVVPYLPDYMVALIQRVAKKLGMELEDVKPHAPHNIVFYGKDRPLFNDIRLPEDVKFQHLTDEHIDLINSSWVNQYNGSRWFFNMLIKMKNGYGLYKRNELVCWMFVNEIGSLSHLFTLEEHRRKGYAKTLVQLVCNIRLKDNKDVYACCLSANDSALKMYENLDFDTFHIVRWTVILPK